MRNPRTKSKDLRVLFAKATQQGWVVTITKKNHYQLKSPDGGIVHCPSTPSDFRSMRNTLALMKQHGYKE